MRLSECSWKYSLGSYRSQSEEVTSPKDLRHREMQIFPLSARDVLPEVESREEIYVEEAQQRSLQ